MIADLTLGALGALIVVAVWWDLRERRIPNLLTVTAWVVALLLRGLEGPAPLVAGLVGTAFALILALPFVALGGLGGGDAKLLAAVGAFLGPQQLLIAAAVTAMAGALLAIVLAIHRGVLYETVVGTGALVARLLGFGFDRPRPTIRSPGAFTIPYAVPIAIGVLAVVWLI